MSMPCAAVSVLSLHQLKEVCLAEQTDFTGIKDDRLWKMEVWELEVHSVGIKPAYARFHTYAGLFREKSFG